MSKSISLGFLARMALLEPASRPCEPASSDAKMKIPPADLMELTDYCMTDV